MPRSYAVPVKVGSPHYVTPVKAYLVEASIFDPLPPDRAPAKWGEELELEASLSLYRHSLRKMTVALTVASTENAPVEFTVVYACDFVLSDAVPPEGVKDAWESLAFELAPALLYPYVRAEVSRLTSHSRVKGLVLPFLAVPIERPEDFELPEPERGVQRELPLTADLEEAEETDEVEAPT